MTSSAAAATNNDDGEAKNNESGNDDDDDDVPDLVGNFDDASKEEGVVVQGESIYEENRQDVAARRDIYTEQQFSHHAPTRSSCFR